MEDSEAYFPRGGKKPVVNHFKASDNFLRGIEQAEKKRKKPKKKSDDDGYLSDDEGPRDLEQSIKNCASGIYYETVKPGFLILGRVRQVLETKVNVMLPSKMMGSVMACHISEPYNKLLDAYVNDQTEKVPELQKMFRPGQYVALKVLEAIKDNLMLSMMPQHINNGKTHIDLQKGTLLQAAVSSIEDHGYVMDVGIPNTRAFLPDKNTNSDVVLDNGTITWCVVKSVSTSADTSTVTLSSALAALQSAVQRRPTAGLLPAAAVDFTVDKALENGVEGRIFNDTVSYVQRCHADTSKKKRPKLGQKIQARVLYVMPIRNTPFLTTRDIFETTYPDLEEEQKLKEGDIIEEAQVIKITGRSIHFKLGAGSIGTLSLKRIHVDEDLTDEQVVMKSYPIGSTHRVRVLCYHLSDYVYSVTDEPAVLEEKYFCVSQLRPGELVPATVKVVEGNRLLLSVGRITGYVPRHHLTDAGMFLDPKKATTSNLTKKFRVGQEVKARVLSVNVPGATAFLTLKPSLLDPQLETLTSYEEAQPGKVYTGTIQVIKDYILVSFFNNVIAYIPRLFVTRTPVDNFADVFHVGQIVKCTILRVDPENKKMSGSFVTSPFTPGQKREKSNKNEVKTSQDTDDVPNKRDITEEIETSKNKKRKRDEIVSEDIEINENETKKKRKKNKNKDKETVDQNKEVLTNNEDLNTPETLSKRESKDKKVKTKENKKNNLVMNEEPKKDLEQKQRKNIKVKKDSIKEEESQESDAIETDIYEDSDQVLTPQDLGLVDLSDCTTPKKYKKRVVSLLKDIKARMRRIDKIDNKILKIEETGLNPENKQFHTAMHREKIVIQERVKKLTEALQVAQSKLKEFDLGDTADYKKKQVKKDVESDKNIKEKQLKEDKPKKVKNIKVVENLAPALEVPSAKDFWTANTDNSITANTKDESSSSEEEEESQPKKKRKKLTVAEKVAKVREEEERVREMERRAIESDSQPRSVEQFERALLASPDCSQLWIAYMAFHLQATEIEKARAVGRKGLKTIAFREEEEKLNVWLALLNCEHRFGTKESQQKTLEEALQMNEPFKIHSKLLDIFIETSKQQELTSLVDLMLRKYKRDPATYTRCGNACFKLGLVEKARQVMQKGVSMLDKKEHIAMLVQFALMERSAGERERAEALFEQILATYPQRVDVCNTYVDMLVKSSDIDRVRQVMERITAHKLPARKMKVLYKKWVEVEEKLGDAERAESVRQLAIDYIDKAKF